jgi:hypothetical protein
MASTEKQLAKFIFRYMGPPDYIYTLTFKPIFGSRRYTTKINDSVQAMSLFLHLLNSKCLGHGHRRKGFELGFYACLEGLSAYEQQHWHGAIRLPRWLSHEKFLKSFEFARRRVKRLGNEFDLKPFRDEGWIEYSLKTGIDSFHPEFLRRGSL